MRVGVSKPRGFSPSQFLLDPKWTSAIDLTEWDMLDLIEIRSKVQSAIHRKLSNSSHQTIIGVSAKYLLANHEASFERMSILSELRDAFHATAIIVRATSESLSAIQESTSKVFSSEDIWVDCGRELPSTSPLQIVHDPMWHKLTPNTPGRVFKLHGWHPTRWVRYYGQEHLDKLSQLTSRHRPKVVLFAHSMRNEEALRFNAIQKGSA